jgi:arsenite methyltransferase
MNASPATWLAELIGAPLPPEGGEVVVRGQCLGMQGGVLRARALPHSETQTQTAQSFSYLWEARDRFQGAEAVSTFAEWYRSMYGDVASAIWWRQYGEWPLLVDAGCGAGISALGLFGDRLHRTRYLGVDISTAVDAAAQRFAARGIAAAFLQADLMRLPLEDCSVDVIFSQGALHHTDSTRGAILALARKLRPGGRFLLYVYRKKGPIREFTDDYIRGKLAGLPADEVWQAILPLTKLGSGLAQLNVEIEVPEAIELLGIPAGKIDLQRFFYWYVFKAYHRSEWSLAELNHVNVDWYAPANAHRQTPEQVRSWCGEAHLEIEREHLQESGIAVVARKTG